MYGTAGSELFFNGNSIRKYNKSGTAFAHYTADIIKTAHAA